MNIYINANKNEEKKRGEKLKYKNFYITMMMMLVEKNRRRNEMKKISLLFTPIYMWNEVFYFLVVSKMKHMHMLVCVCSPCSFSLLFFFFIISMLQYFSSCTHLYSRIIRETIWKRERERANEICMHARTHTKNIDFISLPI